jgi:hypothetical protein
LDILNIKLLAINIKTKLYDSIYAPILAKEIVGCHENATNKRVSGL